MTARRPVIVGSAYDPHVRSVVEVLGADAATIFDARELGRSGYLLSSRGFEFENSKSRYELVLGARGWIRRLAPAGWSHGAVVGSRPAVVQAALLSLLAAVIRLPGTEWLTSMDDLLISESKIGQLTAAAAVGVAAPATVVTNRREHVQEILGDQVVIKPLGAGHFHSDAGDPVVVYATLVDLRDREFEQLGEAPFLFQEPMKAIAHLRVVTVVDQVFAAMLPASGLPLDWRSEPAAHQGFTPLEAPPDEVSRGAVRVAQKLHLGLSSQDWVLTDDGPYLLDVNPSGQWLFLPESVASGVTIAIAAWLRNGADNS